MMRAMCQRSFLYWHEQQGWKTLKRKSKIWRWVMQMILGMLKKGSLWDSNVEVTSRHLDVHPVTQRTDWVKNKELGVRDKELGLRNLRNSLVFDVCMEEGRGVCGLHSGMGGCATGRYQDSGLGVAGAAAERGWGDPCGGRPKWSPKAAEKGRVPAPQRHLPVAHRQGLPTIRPGKVGVIPGPTSGGP